MLGQKINRYTGCLKNSRHNRIRARCVFMETEPKTADLYAANGFRLFDCVYGGRMSI